MKSVFLLVFSFFAISTFAFSQSEFEQMRTNSNWIVGKGTAINPMQADDNAIKDLLSQISISVEASFESFIIEENGNVEEYCQSALKTYSNTQLNGAERAEFEEDDGSWTVYRYILRDDMDQIFQERAEMVRSFINLGLNAEHELRIDAALMNYYSALILLRTHPGWRNVRFDYNGHEESLITFLPDRIIRVFNLLTLECSSPVWDEDNHQSFLKARASFNNQPIQSLELQYYCGNCWSEPISLGEDGALLEFPCQPDNVLNPIKIGVIYFNKQQARYNADIARIANESCLLPQFPQSQMEVRWKTGGTTLSEPLEVKVQTRSESIDAMHYLTIGQQLCEALQSRRLADVDELCNDSGKRYFEMLIGNGQGRIVNDNASFVCERYDDKTIVRGVSMQFSFPQSGCQFVEPLVFTFDKDDKLEKIAFGLTESAQDDILGSVKATPIERQRILAFIEDYKTAYCLKDIDFIEKVFADNALIIVGSVVKNDPDTDIEGMYRRLGPQWKATRLSKQTYVRNLRNLFSTNEFVSLRFEDNTISRSNNPEDSRFGIQIHQHYYSQHYADEGYLFLMFDLADTSRPKIYVRTWQPEKNPDGSIFGLEDFTMEDSLNLINQDGE